jgi:hypothetical protein
MAPLQNRVVAPWARLTVMVVALAAAAGISWKIVAQRTANVSKTVFTQCNSIVALDCYDKTTVEYLSGMYGERYAQLVRQLPRLHAIGFGNAFRSDRPVVFEIPYSETKTAKGRPTALSIAAQASANA